MRLLFAMLRSCGILFLGSVRVSAFFVHTTTLTTAARHLPKMTSGGTALTHTTTTTATRLQMAAVQSLQIRGIDPSETRLSVGDVVVAQNDFPAYGLWQFESYTVHAITDVVDNKAVAAVSTLDEPLPDHHARLVTLMSGRLRSPVTLRLAGLYSHGLTSLWILDNQL